MEWVGYLAKVLVGSLILQQRSRLNHQPLFGKMSPRSPPQGGKPDLRERQKSSLAETILNLKPKAVMLAV